MTGQEEKGARPGDKANYLPFQTQLCDPSDGGVWLRGETLLGCFLLDWSWLVTDDLACDPSHELCGDRKEHHRKIADTHGRESSAVGHFERLVANETS